MRLLPPPSFPCSASRCQPLPSIRLRPASRPCLRRPTASAPRIWRRARRSSAGFRSHRSAPAGRSQRSLSSRAEPGPMLAAMADLKPAYLITGTDRPKVTRAVRKLRDRMGDDATELLSALETGGEEIVASCNALGLFVSERRLLVVEHVESWKAAEAEPVVDYLKTPSPETVLALVGEGIKKDSALGKAVTKAGELLLYDLPKRGTRADLPGWVGRQFAALGIKVDPSVSRLLVDLV